jgi:hypothetical protein
MEKQIEKTVGRPRKHKDGAARVKAFRAKAAYPGHRCDVYLDEEAFAVLKRLMKQSGLSTSGAINSVLLGSLKLSATNQTVSGNVL